MAQNIRVFWNFFLFQDLFCILKLSKRFFKATVGNGSDTTITVTHNFGTKFVMVQCADNATNGTDPGETVLVDTERATNNTVKLYFASAPANNSIDVMIVNCNI